MASDPSVPRKRKTAASLPVPRTRKTAASLPSSAKPSSAAARASLPSSAEPSSAAARPWEHDVFLSFCGEDTGKSFTSHLFRGLIKRRITTFMGEVNDFRYLDFGFLPSSTRKAIEGSRFAIVVLSKNYSSAWCLEELASLFLLMDDVDFRILPVFYGVHPADFGKAASTWENPGQYRHQWKQWSDALAKVHRLSGWDSSDYNTDEDLVEAVVESVWNRVKHVKTNTGGFEVFEATRKAMDEVTKALNNDKVTVVGVYGVGGVGKTTMVKHVCAEVLSKGMFHHVITAVVSKSPDLGKVQGTLADMLGLKLEEET